MNKPVLLCVDDEEMILLSLKDQLKEHFARDYSIETVESGDDALEFFKELIASSTDVPLLICDQIMPGMKGDELLREVHKLSPRTLKILLTGQADVQAVGKAVNSANLYRYIAKPWDETDLILTIKEAVRSYYQDKKLEEQNQVLREMNENLETLVVERTAEVVTQNRRIQAQLESIEQQREELELRNEFIQSIFGRYVTDDVMATLLENPEGLKFGGERRQISMLISDIRGFTSITERLTPERVVAMLNNYLGKMIDIVMRFQGTVIEFLGDGIMVVFGAPKRMQHHSASAIACALSMQQAMIEVNEENKRSGFPEMQMGIGINTGEVVVGNIGSDKRAKYGVVGLAVNLASRLESLAVGEQVLISESTKASCTCDLEIVSEFTARLKGVEEPVPIYDISGISGPFNIQAPRRETNMQDIPRGLHVSLWCLEGNSVMPEKLDASIIQISSMSASLVCEEPLELLSNVKLEWKYSKQHDILAEVYGKVLGMKGGCYHIRFTSVSPEAEMYIHNIVGVHP